VHQGRVSREQVLAVAGALLGQLGDGFRQEAELFSAVALADEFVEFTTRPAGQLLPGIPEAVLTELSQTLNLPSFPLPP
jgi:hypothetical protein